MNWKPQDVVAMILSIGILVFILGGVFVRHKDFSEGALVVYNLWHDVVKVLLGGLIGYMMSRGSDSDGF